MYIFIGSIVVNRGPVEHTVKARSH